MGVKAIPAQDVIASPSNEDVGKQVGELLLPFLDQLEILLKVRGSHWKIGFVILVEEFNLVIDIPCALVSGSRGQEAASSPCSQECLDYLIALYIRIAKVVALVDEHKVPVPVLHVVQKEIDRALVILN